MRPTRLSAQLLHDLPPVLAHYLEQERHLWLEGIPKAGKLFCREQPGVFTGLEELAVEQRVLVESVGENRARAIQYREGFELGRSDAACLFAEFNGNARLALQSAPVFRQLQGWYIARTIRFEFDLSSRTLYRELVLRDCAEALAYQLWGKAADRCVCWRTAGYLSGQVVEILNAPVVTVETDCVAKGDKACRFVSKFEAEWDAAAGEVREILAQGTVQAEIAKYEEQARAARRTEQTARIALNELNRRLRSDLMLESLVGDSEAMQPVMRRARQVIESDVPVLEIGEFGVGRETLARAIHFGGPRKQRPFVAVDCLGLRGDLLTQELFGFAKDGIPGASRPYTGACVRAHGGTLYLNEVSHLPVEAQVLLLRVLREGLVFPIGADVPIKSNVRVVAATQADLPALVDEGAFLEHLYHALAIMTIEIPPLHQRDGDVLRLAEAFLIEFREHYRRPEAQFSQAFKQALLDCAWPGNVRQLRNVIEHAVIMGEGSALDLDDLPDDVLATRSDRPQNELTREVVLAALRRSGNNRSRAADLLGIGRTSLWRAMKRLELE